MPSGLVKSLAKKANVSVEEVEEKWEKAKSIAKEEYPKITEDSDRFYAVVVGILKNMLGLKDEQITTSNMGNLGPGPVVTMYRRKVQQDKKKKKKPVIIHDSPSAPE